MAVTLYRWPEFSHRLAHRVERTYAYSARLPLFACSCASSDFASLPLMKATPSAAGSAGALMRFLLIPRSGYGTVTVMVPTFLVTPSALA